MARAPRNTRLVSSTVKWFVTLLAGSGRIVITVDGVLSVLAEHPSCCATVAESTRRNLTLPRMAKFGTSFLAKLARIGMHPKKRTFSERVAQYPTGASSRTHDTDFGNIMQCLNRSLSLHH